MSYTEWFEKNEISIQAEYDSLSPTNKIIYDLDDVASYRYDLFINQTVITEVCYE